MSPQPEKIKPSEFLIQCGATTIICFLACQTGFVYAWPSYTTALFKSNETVLAAPMSSLQLSLLGSITNVGGLAVSPFCSYAFNTLGRKYATMLFALPYVSLTIYFTLRARYPWLSYTTAVFKDNETVLAAPMSLELSLLGGITNVGGLVVSPFCSYAINILGRTYATMLFELPYVLTWTIMSLTTNVTFVLLAMMLAGVGVAGQNVSIIYISEISHDSIRGAMTAGSASGYTLGLLIGYILGGHLSYIQVVHTHLALSMLSLVLLMLLRESPAYLVLKGRDKDAAESIAFYRRLEADSKEVGAEISKLKLQLDPRLETMLEVSDDPETANDLIKTKEKLEIELKTGAEPSWKLLLKSKSSKRALVTVLTIMTLTIMMGCVVLQVYAEPLFKEAVPSLPTNLCAIFVALDFLVASLMTVALIDRCGRKMLLMVAGTLSGLCTLLLGAQLQFHWFPPWCTALLIYIYSFIYTTGCATIPFVLAAEVFLPEVRSFCNSIVMSFVWIFTFLTLLIFNPLVESVGLGPVFYLFSCVCFIGAGYSYYFVPETKGLSVTDIQKAFLKNK